MDYKQLCKKIFEIDPQIRYVGISDNTGNLMVGGNKDGKESFLTTNEASMAIHYTLDRWEKNSNLSHRIGNEKSSVTEFDKVSLITIPFSKNELLLISTEPNTDYFKIKNKTVEILSNL